MTYEQHGDPRPIPGPPPPDKPPVVTPTSTNPFNHVGAR